jgi:hypothetical protein
MRCVAVVLVAGAVGLAQAAGGSGGADLDEAIHKAKTGG